MAAKVRISYENPQELHTVLKLLKPIIKSYKAGKGKDGQYKKAYLEVDVLEQNAQKRAGSQLA